MKKKVLIIIPDTLMRATGGMGENLTPTLQILSADFDFYVVGFPSTPDLIPSFIQGYKSPDALFPDVTYSPLSALYSQIEYFSTALTFPRPDLVWAYDWSVYLSAVKVAEHYGCPLVAHVCLSAILLGRDGFTFGLDTSLTAERAIHHALCEMEKYGLSEADRIVHISRGYASRFGEATELHKKSSIVTIGVDQKKFQEDLPPYTFPGTRKKKVIYLGRFTEVKGIIPLCQARIPDDIDLIFIGRQDMAEEKSMRAILQKCKENSNVHYIGPLYDTDKNRAVRSADGLIFPSLHEPLGSVGLESLAAGCITLSSRVDGIADYLNNETSIYCGKDAATIEKALQTFLTMSEADKEKMRKAGYEMVRPYTFEETARQTKEVFDGLI